MQIHTLCSSVVGKDDSWGPGSAVLGQGLSMVHTLVWLWAELDFGLAAGHSQM